MKRKLNKVMCLISFIVFFSCTSKGVHEKKDTSSNETISFPMNYSYMENLKNDSLRKHKLSMALGKGDTLAYISISKDYLLGGGDDMFLYYALMMSNKHDYHMAYFDVYRYYSRFKNNKMFDLLADYYLLKAYFKKNRSATGQIAIRFGDELDEKRLQQYLDKLERELYKNDIRY